MQVAEPDAEGAEIVQQRGDPGAIALGFVGVYQLPAVRREGQAMRSKRSRNSVEPLLEVKRQLLPAQLAHQLGFVLDQDELALIDDADAVGDLLGLLDVMGGENDGDARAAQ